VTAEPQTRPDPLTVPQVASELQISEYMTRELLKAGRIRGVKIGALWRVRRADLVAFLAP
jgi:excisionase family DNA binding protein